MLYQKRYVDEEKWIDVSKEDVVNRLEGAGYYYPGTVIDILNNGEQLRTPWALFRAVPEGGALNK